MGRKSWELVVFLVFHFQQLLRHARRQNCVMMTDDKTWFAVSCEAASSVQNEPGKSLQYEYAEFCSLLCASDIEIESWLKLTPRSLCEATRIFFRSVRN